MPTPLRILYCHCAYAQVVPKAVKEEVLRRLADAGVAFDAVADLCEMSAKRDPALKRLAQEGNVKIAACYPRAVKWLFSAAGAPLPEQGIEVLNMRTQTAEEVAGSLLSPASGSLAPVPRGEGGGEGRNDENGANLLVSLPRYSGGGQGGGPENGGRAPTIAPPPQPSPGVPEEGAKAPKHLEREQEIREPEALTPEARP